MSDVPEQRDYIGEGRKTTTADRVVDLLKAYKHYLFLSVFVFLLAGALGLIEFPEVSDFVKLTALCVVAGPLLANFVAWPQIKGYTREERVLVALTDADGDVFDAIKIPENVWKTLELKNGYERYTTISGRRIYAVRAIDLEEELAVSAGDRPSDDEIPGHIEIIGSGAHEKYHELAGPMMLEFRNGTNRKRDKRVVKEESRREVVNEKAVAEEQLESGTIEVKNSLDPDDDHDMTGDELIQKARSESNTGDEDDE